MNKQMTNSKDGTFEGRLYSASEVKPSFTLRRPTGILSLDVAIRGGAPAGCMTEIIGKDSAGKSTLGNFILAENQQVYGNRSAIYIATIEGQFDKDHARECGMRIAYSEDELDDLEKRTGVKLPGDLRQSMMEDQVGEVLEVRGANAEIVLDQVIELSRSNLFQIGLLDSVAALLPETEDEGSVADQRPANSARLMAKFCRKWSGVQSLDKDKKFNNTTLIATNQFRVRMGVKMPPGMPPPMEHPGGHAFKHTKSLSIKLTSTKRDRFADKETKETLGKVMHWEILKQKHGGHEGDTGQFRYYYGTHQVDVAYDAFQAALNQGVVERVGTGHYKWQNETHHGEKAMVAVFRDREKRQILSKEVLEAAGIRCLVGT